ncbi:transglutaminase domain-containing protein [Hymenobacter rigui]|uniref:Transglutaminase-like domain-containing protein n=1 Tax=Hymenobacter rigui TaxID=334424 RepID=A0A428KVI6_9BACT|nr:transglutaminase domain-containing protein [Hymenobacter rigui]RSK50840.1 hypothetical protein EI291_00530 [Hymenobacter rigui]
MRRHFYFFLLVALLLSSSAHRARAQKPVPRRTIPLNMYQSVDARMLQVPDSVTHTVGGLARFITANFSSEADKARAAFVWVARNIRYDVENMYVISFTEEPVQTVRKALAKRTGVCTDYAELYNAIVSQAGLKSYVVTGYTKQQSGALAPVGHAWCATRIDGQWTLMDPTWSAGYVSDDTYVARFTEEYFRVPPSTFIRRHMPYDPLWQLLPTPLTPRQFQQSSTPAPAARPFSVADSVAAYERQTPGQQRQASTRRIEQAGISNALLFNYLSHIYIAAYNDASNEFNAGIAKLNDFIEYYNHQFLPKKTDEELQQLLPPIAQHFKQARALLAGVHIQDQSQQTSVRQFTQMMQEADTKLGNCQAFMTRYLQTRKLLRPTLFMNLNAGRNELAR